MHERTILGVSQTFPVTVEAADFPESILPAIRTLGSHFPELGTVGRERIGQCKRGVGNWQARVTSSFL
jgi:hypothetical protein